MRHLRVPSEATAQWRDRLLAEGWLAAGVGIQADGDHRLVPLTDAAPETGSSWYEGHATVERSSLERGPQHWRERLDAAMLEQIGPSFRPRMKFKGTSCWSNSSPRPSPMSRPSLRPCSISSPRPPRLCGRGRHGAVSRSRPPCCLVEDGNQSTVTTVKEHGLAYTLDPSTAYFSARLSGERQAAMDLIEAHRTRLGRRLVVHDPYAGVGPNLGLRSPMAR